MIPDSDGKTGDRQHFVIYKVLPHPLPPATLIISLWRRKGAQQMNLSKAKHCVHIWAWRSHLLVKHRWSRTAQMPLRGHPCLGNAHFPALRVSFQEHSKKYLGSDLLPGNLQRALFSEGWALCQHPQGPGPVPSGTGQMENSQAQG